MSWKDFFQEEEQKPYYQALQQSIIKEYKENTCYPPFDLIFNAFKVTPLNRIKVVILGQDPYHEYGQAHGLAFSVLCEKLPPSLQNIYKEMASDLQVVTPKSGNLEYLATQGVFLLNSLLSVRDGQAFSHKGLGWETFVDNVIKKINEQPQPIVFILWGAPAQSKERLLDNPNHLVIKSVHPSPLSAYRGFFGSKPFSKANEFLSAHNVTPIEWVKA